MADAKDLERRGLFAAVSNVGMETGITKLVPQPVVVRVLVIDAESALWTRPEARLPQPGFVVAVQNPADVVLASLRTHAPDAILISARVPRSLAADVSNAILELSRHREFAVLLMVGDNDGACIERWNALDFDIISMPLVWPVLPAQIRRSVHAARARELYRAVERRNRALLRALPDMVLLLEKNGAVLDHFGRAASSVDGKPVNFAVKSIDEILSSEGVQKVRDFLNVLHETREPQVFEHKEAGHQFADPPDAPVGRHGVDDREGHYRAQKERSEDPAPRFL